MGLPGVIISSIVALIFVEIPWETSVFFKKYFKSSALSYIMDILQASVICCVASFASYLVCLHFVGGIWGIVLRLIVTVAFGVVIYIPFICFAPKYGNVKKRLVNLFQRKGRQ
jgi:hypothetical protein